MKKLLLLTVALAISATASTMTAYCSQNCQNSVGQWPGNSDPTLISENFSNFTGNNSSTLVDPTDGLLITGPGTFAVTGGEINASTPITITGLPSGVTEIGIQFKPIDLGPVYYFFVNGNFAGNYHDNVQSAEFLGFTSDTPINSFTIQTANSGYQFQIGSIEFGPGQAQQAETPEVATLLTIGSGLVGIGALRRKRRAAARGTVEMMQEILDKLPEAERRALAAYYNGCTEHEACAREGVGIGKFRDLRAEVRGAYFRAVNEKGLPPEVHEISPLEVALLEA